MTTLRLVRVAKGPFDHVVASLGEATLARTAHGTLLTIEERLERETVRALAFAGVRAEQAEAVRDATTGLIAARGLALEPVRQPLPVDIVRLECASLGGECVRLLRFGRLPLSRGRAQRRARCLALLRGQEVAFLWERHAWGPAAIYRDREVRAVLRPAVFGGSVAETAPPTRRAYASSGVLARWAFS